jgi:hypothetical protein
MPMKAMRPSITTNVRGSEGRSPSCHHDHADSTGAGPHTRMPTRRNRATTLLPSGLSNMALTWTSRRHALARRSSQASKAAPAGSGPSRLTWSRAWPIASST